MCDYVLLLWCVDHYAYRRVTSGEPTYIAGVKAFGVDGTWLLLCTGPQTGRNYYVLRDDSYVSKRAEFIVAMFELFVPANVCGKKYDTNYPPPYIIEEV